MRISDGKLVAASLSDPTRFAGIFDRHIGSVRQFVYRRLGTSRGDDVVSEVFRVAFERRSSFDTSVDSALPWLYGICVNLVRREHRSYARRAAALERADSRAPTGADPLVDVASQLDAKARAEALAGALLALSDEEQEILLLVALEQLTPSEAAAVLDIPAATARTRLYRARQQITNQLHTDKHAHEVITDAY